MSRSVMVFGLGDVGAWVLEFLARSEGVDTIVTADVREDWGRYRTEMAAIGATMNGHRKAFKFHVVDLQDVDQATRVLNEVRPGVIVNTTSLLSPRLVREGLAQIPSKKREPITEALPLGVQLPWHLALASRLMRAVERSGVAAPVVNVAFSDVVNPILWASGMRVTCGAGNCEHVAYEIMRRVSEREDVPIDEVDLYFVGGGSALLHYGPRKLPFYLRVFVRKAEVTDKYDPVALVEEAIQSRFFQPGKLPQLFSTPGASAAKNAMAILNDTNAFMPVNAPQGLVGDYPARLGAKGAEVVLPPGFSLEEAAKIGEAALKWHGIEVIREDGTVVYTDEAYYGAKEWLGYECKELHLDEIEPRARELMNVYRGLAKRYG